MVYNFIRKAGETKVKPSKVFLTYAHPDHAWGPDLLVKEFQCPASSWQDLYRSITQTLFSFSDDTALHPGHGPATTVGEEKRHNPFFCGQS